MQNYMRILIRKKELIDKHSMSNCCELCGRMTSLTRHHLIPKRVHRSESIRAKFTKEALNQRIAELCRGCHRDVHRTFKERELAVQFHSVALLCEHPDIQAFVDWIKDKPDDFSPRLSRRKRK